MNKHVLTCKRLHEIILDCLFKDGEDTSKGVVVEGIKHNFSFHPERLENHKAEIGAMLRELPSEFSATGGGGWSFIQACVTKDGKQWGEHPNIEELLVLGIATKQAKICLPRTLWSVLPGGMPYFSVSV